MSTNTPDKNGHNTEPEKELRIEDLVAEAQQENAEDTNPTTAYPQATPTTAQDEVPTTAYSGPHTATPNYPYVPPAAYPTGTPVAVGTRVEAPINRTPRAFTIVWGMLLLAFGVLLVAKNVWDISVDPITLAFTVVTAAGAVLVGCGIGMVVRNARNSQGAK